MAGGGVDSRYFGALVGGVCSTLLVGCGEGAPSGESPAPHVFVVIVDTLRHDAVGDGAASGSSEGSATPCLDAFSQDAVVFEQAISASSWTLPSVASILTGAWPSVHRAEGRLPMLRAVSPDVPLAAERFDAAGYTTAGFANAAFLSPLLGFDRGFDTFDHVHAFNVECRRADESVDAALEHCAAVLDDGPAFVLLHLFDPHLDYDPPEGYRPARGPEAAPISGAPISGAPISWGTVQRWTDVGARPPDDVQDAVRAAYRGEVEFVDAQLGRFFEGLERLGVLEDSVVAVVADHGEEHWDRGGFEHGHTLHRELVHVPLIVRFPAGLGLAPARVGATVRTVDLLPTLLELAGLEENERMGGSSLMPLARGESEEARPAHSEGCLYGSPRQALRHEGMLWIVDGPEAAAGPGRLYDLATDPFELEDLARQEPARVQRARLWWMDHAARVRRQAQGVRQAPAQDLSPDRVQEYVESLRSLGYVDRER